MTDSTDDMEFGAARLYCRECGEHFEDCECAAYTTYQQGQEQP